MIKKCQDLLEENQQIKEENQHLQDDLKKSKERNRRMEQERKKKSKSSRKEPKQRPIDFSQSVFFCEFLIILLIGCYYFSLTVTVSLSCFSQGTKLQA